MFQYCLFFSRVPSHSFSHIYESIVRVCICIVCIKFYIVSNLEVISATQCHSAKIHKQIKWIKCPLFRSMMFSGFGDSERRIFLRKMFWVPLILVQWCRHFDYLLFFFPVSWFKACLKYCLRGNEAKSFEDFFQNLYKQN